MYVTIIPTYNARQYLHHRKGLLYNDNFENTRLFKLDAATFTERKQFYPGTIAYESVN